MTHTEKGMATLKRFLVDIAGVTPDWSMENVLEEQLEIIRAKARTDPHGQSADSSRIDVCG